MWSVFVFSSDEFRGSSSAVRPVQELLLSDGGFLLHCLPSLNTNETDPSPHRGAGGVVKWLTFLPLIN